MKLVLSILVYCKSSLFWDYSWQLLVVGIWQSVHITKIHLVCTWTHHRPWGSVLCIFARKNVCTRTHHRHWGSFLCIFARKIVCTGTHHRPWGSFRSIFASKKASSSPILFPFFPLALDPLLSFWCSPHPRLQCIDKMSLSTHLRHFYMSIPIRI